MQTSSSRIYWFWSALLAFSLLFGVVFSQQVLAATSPSYQLQSAPQSGESSVSASYSLCGRINDVVPSGASSSYSLKPLLECGQAAIVTPPGGGGGGHRPSICGNSLLGSGEQCDDGNLVNGDGCSDMCLIETPGTGTTGTGTTGTGTTGTGTTGTGTTGTTGAGTTGTGTTGTGTTGTTGTGTTGTGTTGTGTTGTGTTGTGTTGTTGTGTSGTGTTGTGTTGAGTTGTGTTGTGTTGTTGVGIVRYAPDVRQPVVVQNTPSQAEIDAALRQTYVTNDIETLFFEQFPNGSGEYEIHLQGPGREYEIEVIQTTPGYFSFHLLEDLPDGWYSIQVHDLQNIERTLTLRLLVEEQEKIESPLLLEFDQQDLSLLETLDGLVTSELQPTLSGETILPATIAFYSTQLDETFIVYTDDQNHFRFQYPEKLVAGTFEELRIIAHYENGYVSKPYILRFEVSGTPHFVADENSVIHSPIFSTLGIVLLFLISTITSLYFFGFISIKSPIILLRSFLKKIL